MTPLVVILRATEHLQEGPMPRGAKSSHADKQKRQAKHIERSERDAGKDKPTAERIAWAAVNKRNGERNASHESQRHGDHH